MSDSKRVNEKTRVTLNVLAVRAIEAARRANHCQTDPAWLGRALDEIERQVREARHEIDKEAVIT
jgi:hypothetical protein